MTLRAVKGKKIANIGGLNSIKARKLVGRMTFLYRFEPPWRFGMHSVKKITLNTMAN